jgi:hypothetical protein
MISIRIRSAGLVALGHRDDETRVDENRYDENRADLVVIYFIMLKYNINV